MSKDDFASVLAEVMAPRDWNITLIADSPEGERIPVGSLMAMNPLGTRLVWIADIIWFKWSSSRNRVESIANFINGLRDDFVVTEFADEREPETKRFFENLCMYGIMRRVGTVHDFYGPGNSAALYQSRKRKN